MSIKDSPPIVKIAIMTLITVIIWVSFDVYRALTIEPSPTVPSEILLKLDPSLDAEALNQLQNRVYIAEEQIRNNVINLEQEVEIPLEIQNIIIEASQSGQLQQ